MPLIEGTARFWNGDDIGKMIPLITSICLVGLPLLEIYGSNRLVSYKSPFFCLAVLHMIGTLLSFLLVCDPYFQIGLTRKTFVDYSLLDPIAAKATELMVDAASFRIMAFEFFRRGVLGFILYYMSQRVEAFITMGNGKLKIALRVFTAIFIILGQVGCFISMGNAIRQVRYLFLIPSVKLPDYDYLYPFLYNGSILEILMAPWRLVLEVLTLLVSIQFATKEMRSKTVKGFITFMFKHRSCMSS
jgi:hypothetical protein